MCEFLSFVIEAKSGQIYFGDALNSHRGIEAKHNLKPGSYREVEWTSDTEDSLVVRTEAHGDEAESYYRAIILADYGTRKKLLKRLTSGKIDGVDIQERLKCAIELGDIKAIQSCEKAGADVTADDNYAVKWASGNGYLEVVKYLVSKGADVTAGDNYAVKYASRNGHLEVVKYLVSKGADVTAGDNYAVKWASENGHLEVVKYLVSKGAKL